MIVNFSIMTRNIEKNSVCAFALPAVVLVTKTRTSQKNVTVCQSSQIYTNWPNTGWGVQVTLAAIPANGTPGYWPHCLDGGPLSSVVFLCSPSLPRVTWKLETNEAASVMGIRNHKTKMLLLILGLSQLSARHYPKTPYLLNEFVQLISHIHVSQWR